jgi:hypothetical protein
MILELVTFKAPHGASWQSILDDAKTTVPRWRANADLVRKHYLLSDDGRTCAGASPRNKRMMRSGGPPSPNEPAPSLTSPISIS